MKFFQGDRVKIVKVSDDVFGGKHPNGIDEGFSTEGILYFPPEVGKCCLIGNLRTSTVKEIVDDSVFKTRNSTYKLEAIHNVI